MKAEQNRKQECLSNIICFGLGDAAGCYGSSWEEADDGASCSPSLGSFFPPSQARVVSLFFPFFLSFLSILGSGAGTERQRVGHRPALGDGRPQISCTALARRSAPAQDSRPLVRDARRGLLASPAPPAPPMVSFFEKIKRNQRFSNYNLYNNLTTVTCYAAR